MPTVEKHAPGSFCWIELGTTDQNAAKSFYGALFGWSSRDLPIGPGGVYSMFQIEGGEAAAAYTLTPELLARGARPHWMLYVAVDSADDAAARAGQLGAKVMAQPFDVFDVGRMAVIQDPTGAAFAIWQARKHIGATIAGVPGTLCWADLSTNDPAAASRFYAGLFGWKIAGGHQHTDYLHIQNGEEFIGGIPPAAHRDPEVPPHWLAYILVSDCDGVTAKARQMGAAVHLPPMTMENVGRMAVLGDPQGAVFALFQQAIPA